ncbi:hypothetical protein BaRGS_00016458 [Batillaria attramentaria]|uniref:Kazal-like domain-containing protein n=1 Tax=Batillaria attramentaria TaxID=370345 RepID=A0ABD0KZ32_9CAEN
MDMEMATSDGEGRRGKSSVRCLTLPPGCFTVTTFTATYSSAVLFWSALTLYLASQLPFLEKEFQINSTVSGILFSSSYYGHLAFLLITSHFGKHAHIPRLLSLVVISVGVIALLPAACELSSLPSLPYSRESRIHLNETSASFEKFLCRQSSGLEDRRRTVGTATRERREEDGGRIWVLYVLVFTTLMSGVARSGQTSLPIYYIDNNVDDQAKTGMLTGVLLAAVVIGHPLSLLLGSLTSTIPVDLSDTQLTPGDPRWLGAWWLGFLVLGLGCVISGLPVFWFPRSFHKQACAVSNDSHQADAKVSGSTQEHTGQPKDQVKIKGNREEGNDPQQKPDGDVPGVNKVGRTLLPKSDEKDGIIRETERQECGANRDSKLEEHDQKPPAGRETQDEHTQTLPPAQPVGEAKEQDEASLKELLQSLPRSVIRILSDPTVVLLFSGIVSNTVVAGGYRSFGTKYYVEQFSLPPWTANMALGVTGALSTVTGTLGGGFLFARLRMNKIMALKVAASSADDCNCEAEDVVLLSCGADGNNYLSPCLAGCHNVTGSVYGGCSRVAGGTVTPGLCDNGCSSFIPFLVIATASHVLCLLPVVPAMIAIIRSVESTDKSLAVGLLTFFQTIAGTIPGPIIFGKIIDEACLLWSGGAESTGACLLYDTVLLRVSVMGAVVGFKTLATILLASALCVEIVKSRRAIKGREGYEELRDDNQAK